MANENYTPSVLLALSDDPTLTVISYHLERYGFIVNSARNTESILNSIERIEPDILIIDEDIPGTLKTSDVCSILKSKARTQNINIILTTKTPQINNSSINDHIIKPFVPSELVRKIKLFASKTITITNKRVLNYHDIEMNTDTFKVTRFGKTIHLGPTEFKILQCFLELPGRVLSREHIMNHVWGYSSQVDPRTIDVHINRLRSALKEHEDEIPLIRTIRSAGYSLNIPYETVRA
jgi:two-component system phosphate regulon response regulator PhoB